MIKLAIIDADTIVYKSAGACQRKNKITKEMEYEPVVNAFYNAKRLMLKILKETKCNDYVAYLTESKDATCFRTSLYKDYKANRKNKERPKYYQEVRDYLIKNWDAQVVGTIEADDAVCMKQYQCHNGLFLDEFDLDNKFTLELPSSLCGIDKDLDQVPGLHYNYNKDIFYYITPLEGKKRLYLQMLTGDKVDNIPRIRFQWGMKKEEKEVKKLIHNAKTEKELYNIVYTEINRLNERDNCKNSIDINEQIKFLGQLLYLKTHSTDIYEVPL